MEVTILYEDRDILAVNKPSGLVVHADGRTKETTLTDWIKERYIDIEDVGEPLKIGTGEIIKRWGIVHRIDRETSGIILVAKNQKAYAYIKEQFLNREIEKFYELIVHGNVRYDEGIINLPIGRNKSDFRKRATGKAVRGETKEAITYYETIARKEKLSFVRANPKTGRTHQIRVHFADTGHPILGDKLYSVYRKSPVDIGRLALHARSIEFDLPDTHKIIKITAPYPEDFQKLVDFFDLA